MVKIDKKEINLKEKDLEEVKKIIEEELNELYGNINLEIIDLGNIDWLPTILSFSLGTITSGFLKEIGKEIWSKFKNIFVTSKQEESIPKLEFSFEYKGIEVIAEIESNDLSHLKQAFDKLGEIYDKVTKLNLDNQDISKLRFSLDLEEKRWQPKTIR